MNQLIKLLNDLPLELKIKILYKSGIITKEAQLIKDMNAGLEIPYKDLLYMYGGKSYTKHLINMGILKHYEKHIDIIYIVG
jgi:hypothetical protein